ncbi:MAG: aldehyde dehydrogenase family protein [Phenylobacterium sp.]|uniref:aldehyde dehydrogenase family protein n=1 Tax=Phenylobacterium sp. TaxID=1871053 RepID=UPI00178D865C|nr:aldehyde dehydrogenase family protein [Phenylobacterium sp.]MBA4793106.1 aldehyde dehydrogenase family protein [Phenylobacterium sp.]
MRRPRSRPVERGDRGCAERRPGSGGEWLDIVKPADEAVIGRLAVATPGDLDEAPAAAQSGFQAWRRTTPMMEGIDA